MEAVKHVSISQQVETQLIHLLESGQYQPGEKLPTEMELCRSLGVGRGTVREAFRSLQARGYVEIKPGRGAFAAEQLPGEELGPIEWLVRNEKQLLDAIEIRRGLEPMAARLMAEIGDAEAAERLAQLHEQFLAAVQEKNTERIAELDDAFHSAIVDGSSNRLLRAINKHISQELETFRSKTFQFPQNIKNAVAPHTAILQAIQKQDAASAEAAMRAHLDKVQEDLQENIAASPSLENTLPVL